VQRLKPDRKDDQRLRPRNRDQRGQPAQPDPGGHRQVQLIGPGRQVRRRRLRDEPGHAEDGAPDREVERDMTQPSGVDQRQARPQCDRDREQADREIPAGRVHRFTTGRRV
jgi:hypothetical protein